MANSPSPSPGPLSYEQLSDLQVALAQNEAADTLLTITQLIQAAQELYLPHNQAATAAEGEQDPAKSLGIFKGLQNFKRVVLTPKKPSMATPEKRASASAAPMSPRSPSVKRDASSETKVFDVNMEELPSVTVGTQKLPAIFKDLMEGVRARGLQTEGIFRVSGNVRKVKDLRDMLDAGKPVSSLEINVFECADLFKSWLRCLPEAVIPNNLTVLYIGCAQLFDKHGEEMRDLVVQVLQLFHLVMPKINRYVLQTMFAFLSEMAALSSENKMDSLNISKMMVPNLCRYEKESPQDPEVLVALHKRMALLTRFCIDHHQEIFEIPAAIQGRLALDKENTATAVQGKQGEREDAEREPRVTRSLQHKKITELMGTDDTPRKRARSEPQKKTPTKGTQSPAKSPAKSPRRARLVETPVREPGLDSHMVYGL